MDVQYYYVHGLGSSKNSRKFKEIQAVYPDAICFDWDIGDNLYNKIKMWVEAVKDCKADTVLIGSSTGCNLICQMNEILNDFNIYPKTIFLNPLLSLKQVINKEIMPTTVSKYIHNIDSFNGYLLIIADNDDVLDHGQISDSIVSNNKIITSKNDTHLLVKLKDHFDEIDFYVASIDI